jgi:hypothetical protein
MLFPPDLLLGEDGVLAVADLRRQAVDSRLVDQCKINYCPARRDQLPSTLRQLDLCAVDDGE